MKNRKPVQDISFKYNLTRKKYVNLHKRITDLIKDGSFYELSKKIRKNMWRRLHLLYRRLLKLLSRTALTTAALTASFLMLSNTTNAQTFTNQTGTNNPSNGVDVGDKSSPAFVDIDGDGDMDAFIGGQNGIINYYKNTGTSLSPTFTAQTGTNNPFNGVTIDWSNPRFVDIDGDGDMDSFIGVNVGTIKYYQNTGTALAPTFTLITGTNNPLNVDVGNYAIPTFVDIDGDGDMDSFIGGSGGTIKYYQNTGTSLAPTFTEQTGTNNPFNGVNFGFRPAPRFIDLDSDGDMDSFIGEYDGIINYYKNTSTALAPSFTEQTGTNNPFNGVDVGSHSNPAFIDIDGDGDMDSFIGENLGTILYYKNTSSLHIASFALNTGNNDPFNGVDVGSYSKPSLTDIDSDGDFDIFIGANSSIKYYENTGTVLAPAFTVQIGTNNPLNSGSFSSIASPTFVDIDSDGDMDAFIADSYSKILHYYKNTGTALAPAFTEQTGTNSPFNFNITYFLNPSFADLDGDGDMDAFIATGNGDIYYYKNTGTALAPAFASTRVTGTSDPFNGVAISIRSTPTFADIDNDGDLDCFFGEQFGDILYYKNTGTNIAPAFVSQTGTSNLFNGVNVGNLASPSFADLDADGDFDAFIGNSLGTIKTYADGTNALPVELTTFSAFVSENGVTLSWNTATEVNNYGFEIQRANNNEKLTINNWETLGFVPGHGTSNIPHNYSFIDNNTLGGLKFNYRLKQMDVDGKFEYSDILTVSLATTQKAALMQNSPNPFNPSTSIKFFIPTDADVTIKIYDVIGREVQTLINEQTKAGFHIVFWNGRNNRGRLSASGVYFYRLSTNSGFVQTKKMALLK